MNEVGTKIRNLRELKDYTQEYMASSLGITQSTYAKIEKNETPISLSRLDEIAKVLEIDPLNILTFDKEQVINNNYIRQSPIRPIHRPTSSFFCAIGRLSAANYISTDTTRKPSRVNHANGENNLICLCW